MKERLYGIEQITAGKISILILKLFKYFILPFLEHDVSRKKNQERPLPSAGHVQEPFSQDNLNHKSIDKFLMRSTLKMELLTQSFIQDRKLYEMLR